MRLGKRIAVIAASLALASTLGIGLAGSALATTTVADIAYQGNGSCLDVGTGIGVVTTFGECPLVSYNAEGTGDIGTYYYIHPYGSSYCLTASTTQFGVMKTEACVGATNQLWYNPNSGGEFDYQIVSAYYSGGEVITQSGSKATLTPNYGSFGDNAWTMQQVA